MEEKTFRNRWYEITTAYGLSWGVSPTQGYIVIAKGSVAQEVWRHFLPTARNVSRVDLQVTVKLEEQRKALAHLSYKNCRRHKLKSSVIRNSQGGSTLYLGSRNSDQFGRLYDKGAKNGEVPGFVWRYEVELKRSYANEAIRKLLEFKERDGKELSKLISGYVYSWWRKRGVQPVFSPESGGAIIEVSKTETTLERKLTWLRTQVSPTLRRLIEAGLGEVALDALDLNEYIQQRMELDGQ
jgi:DNA relaxase NicK